MKLADALPNTMAGRTVGQQFVKCSTSMAANYRATCLGRSKAEFNAKLHIVLEEADECVFWLEMIVEGVCAIAQGDNPTTIREKMQAFVSQSRREEVKANI